MRMSQLFGRTLRQAPAEAEMVSHQLALRAGLARQIGAGIYAYLPMGWRVIRRLEAIIREEMDAIGGQEMRMPVVNPAELWQASGRWTLMGAEMLRFRDRAGRDLTLSMTAEELVAELARREIETYRQLPRLVYHFQTKFRDEPRPRGGLIRLREFTMKDAYSFHADAADLDAFYPKTYGAYLRIFERVGLAVAPVEADTGSMGGSASHEVALPQPQGEDAFIRWERCGYAANVEAAQFARARPPGAGGEPLPLAKVPTPGTATIDDLARLLGIAHSQTLKAVFYVRERAGAVPEFIFAVVRGDLGVNEAKLAKAAGGGGLRPATEEEIRAVGAAPGYASPAGLRVRVGEGGAGVTVIADLSIQQGANFATGANEAGHHFINTNYPRDFAVTRVADIAQVEEGFACARCGGRLRTERAIELGHCFKLGTRYAEGLGATYLDRQGEQRPLVMGSYGIGLDRLLAAIIEMHHDADGICWPAAVAPFDVYLVSLRSDAQAGALYADLQAGGGGRAVRRPR